MPAICCESANSCTATSPGWLSDSTSSGPPYDRPRLPASRQPAFLGVVAAGQQLREAGRRRIGCPHVHTDATRLPAARRGAGRRFSAARGRRRRPPPDHRAFGNDELQVFVEAQGIAATLGRLLGRPPRHPAAAGRVLSTDVSAELPIVADESRLLHRRQSTRARQSGPSIPPDVATCDDCLADMADPANRRYRYPFTTCTNCGPRLIDHRGSALRPAADHHARLPDVRRLPRRVHRPDRPPLPRPADQLLRLRPPPAGPRPERLRRRPPPTIAATRTPPSRTPSRACGTGRSSRSRGLGGFHLMCDARNADAVARLRDRKRRSGKPFAVMVSDVARRARSPS